SDPVLAARAGAHVDRGSALRAPERGGRARERAPAAVGVCARPARAPAPGAAAAHPFKRNPRRGHDRDRPLLRRAHGGRALAGAASVLAAGARARGPPPPPVAPASPAGTRRPPVRG